MLTGLRRALRVAFGYRFFDITEDLPDRVTVRSGSTTTSFNRTSLEVTQDGRHVGTFGIIEKIEVHQPRNQDGPMNWFITVQLRGTRQIEVGKVTDKTEASIVAARISGVTGRPVEVFP